jgi:hypothetical protein
MSGYGTQRTSRSRRTMSAFRGKADIEAAARNQCREAEHDLGGHTALGGTMKHLIVGMSASSEVIQMW